MPFREDLDALAARHAALDAEVGAITRERDATKQLLDEVRARARLPVLDNLRVASPCHEDWAKMTGDDRVRACGSCAQSVYNLSELTREQAEQLIVDRGGRLCVRYYQRADGTILLADCEVGRRRTRKRVVIAAGVASVLAIGGVAALANRTTTETPEICAAEHVMGSIAALPDPRPVATPDAIAAPVKPPVMVMMGAVAPSPEPVSTAPVHARAPLPSPRR